jgi:uncharacterized protein YutE (UPF0331/DUF86 family)
MVYDVDVERIEKQLEHLEQCAIVLERLGEGPSNTEDRFALERALHLAVECMIDVGTAMIDGFIMRDPGGYLDIVDILLDEKVIDSKVGNRVKEHVHLRDRLVRYYTEVDLDELKPFLKDSGLYRQFRMQVQEYLKREL